MRQHRIWGQRFSGPGDVFGWLGAIQGQEYGVSRWSIGQRTKRASVADVDEAFARGEFLRTHALRPTWHLVAAEDIRWIQELTGPRVLASTASAYRAWGVTPEMVRKASKVILRELAGGEHLTRRELGERVQGPRIDPTPQQMAWIMMTLELEAVVCSGAMRGKQQTYALVEERVPRVKRLDPDDALAELTRRYFVARGPATIGDFAWWSSLKRADIRRGLEMLGDEVRSKTVEDRTYWFADRPGRLRSGVIDLVQAYEEVVISYTESRDALLGKYGRNPTATRRPPYINTILLDGQVLGHWKPLVRSELVIESFFYRKLTKDERTAYTKAVEDYSSFMQLPASWRVGATPA